MDANHIAAVAMDRSISLARSQADCWLFAAMFCYAIVLYRAIWKQTPVFSHESLSVVLGLGDMFFVVVPGLSMTSQIEQFLVITVLIWLFLRPFGRIFSGMLQQASSEIRRDGDRVKKGR